MCGSPVVLDGDSTIRGRRPRLVHCDADRSSRASGYTMSMPKEPRDPQLAPFWEDVRRTVPGLPKELPGREHVWAFGATAEQADELLRLVLEGTKTGTSSSLWDYEADQESLPRVGQYDVVLDGSGTARAVLRTTRVDVVPFGLVGEDHAFAEGEGDRTLAFWRDVHRDFFERFASHDRGFREDMPVVCERFRVVYPAVRT